MNLFYVFQHGDAVLVLTFLLLIGMSLASWYVIFWKAWKIRQERRELTALKQHFAGNPAAFRQPLPQGISGGAALLARQAEQALSRVEQLEKPERREVLSIYLSQTLDVIRSWLDKGLTILASVGSSAPFIGLFGTVWGIYGALTKIAAEGNASLNVVAGPMGEALVATAVGLFTAIPAVLAYNAFVRMNRLLVQDFRHVAEELTLALTQPESQKPGDAIKLVKGSR